MLYEEGVCHIRNNSWASDNCMRTCGVCSKTPIGMYRYQNMYRENTR